jgi:predicted ATPase
MGDAAARGDGDTASHSHGSLVTIVARLTSYLRDRLMLLLDNFEHVMAAEPFVSELLAACPHVKIFVTSWELLRLRSEHEFTVSPGFADPVRKLSSDLTKNRMRWPEPTEETAYLVAETI